MVCEFDLNKLVKKHLSQMPGLGERAGGLQCLKKKSFRITKLFYIS